MWWQAISSLASAAISAYGANKSAKTSEANAREQRAAPVGAPEFLADKIGFKPAFLRSAISRVCAVLDISVCQARCSRALASEVLADAQAPDYAKAYNSGVANALMIAQTRKTNAEATIVEDHQNQAKLESELYGSGVGMDDDESDDDA
jgi:hypothetical protein